MKGSRIFNQLRIHSAGFLAVTLVASSVASLATLNEVSSADSNPPTPGSVASSHTSAKMQKSWIAERHRLHAVKNQLIYLFVQKALPEASKFRAEEVTLSLLTESARYHFDPIFLLAVIENESQFRPGIIGTHGEVGLMQIKPDTAAWISEKMGLDRNVKETLEENLPEVLKDPAQNIRYGAAYLSFLRDRLGANEQLSLAAYNGGVRRVLRGLVNLKTPGGYVAKTYSHYDRIHAELKDLEASFEIRKLASVI